MVMFLTSWILLSQTTTEFSTITTLVRKCLAPSMAYFLVHCRKSYFFDWLVVFLNKSLSLNLNFLDSAAHWVAHYLHVHPDHPDIQSSQM